MTAGVEVDPKLVGTASVPTSDPIRRQCLASRPTGYSAHISPLGIGSLSSEDSYFKLCTRSVQGDTLKTPSEVPMVMIFN
jgi:hypothetical protein